jgi:hypothetical protein
MLYRLPERGSINPTKTEATAEAFWTGLKRLPPEEQRAQIRRIIRHEALRRELMDLAPVEERCGEPARPSRDCLRLKKK